MRDFINSILQAINTASINDDEWSLIDQDVALLPAIYSNEIYTATLLVLDSREAVSETRNRLRFYFQAKGAFLTTDKKPGKTRVWYGSVLE